MSQHNPDHKRDNFHPGASITPAASTHTFTQLSQRNPNHNYRLRLFSSRCFNNPAPIRSLTSANMVLVGCCVVPSWPGVPSFSGNPTCVKMTFNVFVGSALGTWQASLILTWTTCLTVPSNFTSLRSTLETGLLTRGLTSYSSSPTRWTCWFSFSHSMMARVWACLTARPC